MTKTYLEALLDSFEAFPDEELAHDKGMNCTSEIGDLQYIGMHVNRTRNRNGTL